jgi:hypothetical protein
MQKAYLTATAHPPESASCVARGLPAACTSSAGTMWPVCPAGRRWSSAPSVGSPSAIMCASIFEWRVLGEGKGVSSWSLGVIVFFLLLTISLWLLYRWLSFWWSATPKMVNFLFVFNVHTAPTPTPTPTKPNPTPNTSLHHPYPKGPSHKLFLIRIKYILNFVHRGVPMKDPFSFDKPRLLIPAVKDYNVNALP